MRSHSAPRPPAARAAAAVLVEAHRPWSEFRGLFAVGDAIASTFAMLAFQLRNPWGSIAPLHQLGPTYSAGNDVKFAVVLPGHVIFSVGFWTCELVSALTSRQPRFLCVRLFISVTEALTRRRRAQSPTIM